MPDFVYPTSAELMAIAQEKLPRLTADRPIFDIMPVVEKRASRVMWEQKDNFLGLQQVRGLDGAPARVVRVGGKRYDMEPGVYGEFVVLDEREITTRRMWGDPLRPIDLTDLVMEGQEQLLGRRLDRIEQIGWTLLSTGTFSVAAEHGGILHTDTYTLQTFTAGVVWATTGSATPLANFRAVQLLSRGKSVSFGAGSKAYMNRATFNNLVANTNAADLGGKRTAGLSTIIGINDINTILAGEDLPQIVIYDEGYLDDSGTFQLFVPNNKVVVVGKRPGNQVVAEYQMTANANNPNAGPGAYTKVIDRGENTVPRTVEVHDGHNGGPAIFFPGAIVVMTV